MPDAVQGFWRWMHVLFLRDAIWDVLYAQLQRRSNVVSKRNVHIWSTKLRYAVSLLLFSLFLAYCALSVQHESFCVAGPQCFTEYISFSSSMNPGVQIYLPPATSAADCQQKCRANPACVAFTYSNLMCTGVSSTTFAMQSFSGMGVSGFRDCRMPHAFFSFFFFFCVLCTRTK